MNATNGPGLREHIMVDVYGGNPETLADPEKVRALVKVVAAKIGAKLVEEPYVIPYFDGKVPEDSGVTVIALTTHNGKGGHVTAHTFDQKGTTFFDTTLASDSANTTDVVISVVHSFGGLGQIQYDFPEADITEIDPKVFGPHYRRAGVLVTKPTLEFVYDTLNGLVKAADMTPIAIPKVVKRPDGGFSGIIVIAESHISIHIEPDGTFYLDVFSCKSFDTEAMQAELDNLGFQGSSESLVARGKYFPRG